MVHVDGCCQADGTSITRNSSLSGDSGAATDTMSVVQAMQNSVTEAIA